MSGDAKPAEVLRGLTLDNGWTVTELVARPDDATGGTFSVAYLVERETGADRESAFLKALDFTIINQLGLPIADALKFVTDAYVFERDLVLECTGQRMSNVVRGIDAGEVNVDPEHVAAQYAFLLSVPYIIFEAADGDVRGVLSKDGHVLDEAWALRVLHGVANGLRQLHQAGITHQDVKPSNVMTFGTTTAKVGDLGRASPERGGLFDEHAIAGDRTYAPPELLYGELQPDQRVRRRAVDVYHVASMAVFLFTGTGLTSLIEAELDDSFHWRTWPRTYRNALPYVREAFDRVMVRIEEQLDHPCAGELLKLIRELGDPDPLVRGNGALGDGHRRYSMERYVSIFDRLARRAEIDLRRGQL